MIRWHLQPVAEGRTWVSFAMRVAAVLLALVFGGAAIALAGMSPIELGTTALRSTLGTSLGLEQVGIFATPLILTGLAAAIPYRLRLWNIGAEGQLYLGAWAATGVGIFVSGPEPLMLLVMFLAAAAAGALWMLVPVLARVYANVHEIISTLLLNFVALLLVFYFSIGPWRDKKAAVISATKRVPYELPEWFGSLHVGLFIAVALALMVALAFRYTRWGYEVAYAGANPNSALYAGMPVKRLIISSMLLAGAIAGIAGMIEISGTVHRLQGGISNQVGYLGIVVAALVNGSPIGVIIAGALMAVLLNAGIVLETHGLSVNAVLALTGVILLFTAVGEALSRYRLVRVEPAGRRRSPA